MNGIKRFAFGLMMLLLVSCTSQQRMAMPTPTALPTPAPGKITVLNLMAPVAPAEMTNGSIYFTLQNGTDQPLHLQGAQADVAEALSFHETVNDNGVIRMIPQPEGFTVPAGATLVLETGGKHLMLEKLRKPLAAGEQFTLTLTFATVDPLMLTVPVMEHGAQPMDHSTMHHGK